MRWLRLWVCTHCLDDECGWCQAGSCRCECNDASPAELALADRLWRLADSIGKAPAPVPGGVVVEIQEARRALLAAEVCEVYGHMPGRKRDAA